MWRCTGKGADSIPECLPLPVSPTRMRAWLSWRTARKSSFCCHTGSVRRFSSVLGLEVPRRLGAGWRRRRRRRRRRCRWWWRRRRAWRRRRSCRPRRRGSRLTLRFLSVPIAAAAAAKRGSGRFARCGGGGVRGRRNPSLVPLSPKCSDAWRNWAAQQCGIGCGASEATHATRDGGRKLRARHKETTDGWIQPR